jgi:hypothetical protein
MGVGLGGGKGRRRKGIRMERRIRGGSEGAGEGKEEKD